MGFIKLAATRLCYMPSYRPDGSPLVTGDIWECEDLECKTRYQFTEAAPLGRIWIVISEGWTVE